MDEPASTDARPLQVFLVENHRDTRRMLEQLVRQMGHEVTAVGSIGEALQAWHRVPVDVLLSDIGLPDGDGWELLERLGAERPPVAIAMSGYGMAQDRERSLAAGFREHLVKPMDITRLEALLTQARRERGPASG